MVPDIGFKAVGKDKILVYFGTLSAHMRFNVFFFLVKLTALRDTTLCKFFAVNSVLLLFILTNLNTLLELVI